MLRAELDDLLDHYLVYLEDQGKEATTGSGTRKHQEELDLSRHRVNSPAARADDIDRCFAGNAQGRPERQLHEPGKALLSGVKWARRGGKVLYNPTVGLQLPEHLCANDKLPPRLLTSRHLERRSGGDARHRAHPHTRGNHGSAGGSWLCAAQT